jgi:hypothetical protein
MKKLYLSFLLCVVYIGAHAQAGSTYCTTEFPSVTVGPGQNAPTELCIQITSPNFTAGCEAEMLIGDIPFSWFSDQTDVSKWHYDLEASQDITLYFDMLFTGPANSQSYAIDRNITITYGGESYIYLLDYNPATKHFFGSFTLPVAPADFDNLFEVLEIGFWDNGGPDSDVLFFWAATKIMTNAPKKLISDPLWTTTAPQAPQLILRDPPGDQSFSSFTQADEVCHGYGMSTLTENEGTVWASAKLGAEGSTGFIVETEFEAYVEVSAELSVGLTNLTETSQKMCFKTEDIYSTAAESDESVQGFGDVYIGSSLTYLYGLYETIIHTGCSLDTLKRLSFALSGSEQQFAYPESYIAEIIIPDLEQSLELLEEGTDAYLLQADQLEVWQQYLDLNRTIKEEAIANQVPVDSWNFVAGAEFSNSKTTTTSQVKAVEMNMYIDASVAAEVGVEVAGSGATLGAKIRTRVDRGSEMSASNEHSSTISYYFQDDDINGSENPGADNFSVDLYEDPVFGTPIFIMDSLTSSTSCPYEGGTPIHNPRLVFDGDLTDVTFDNIVDGEPFTFEIDICNESDFAREFFVKVPLETNLSGLQVSIAGGSLNVSNGVTTNIIPANTCLQNALVTISQPTGSSITEYQDIQILMFTECQPSFAGTSSSITFDAIFNGSGLSTRDLSDRSDLLSVFPNPNEGYFTVKLEDLKELSTLEVRDITGRMVYEGQVYPGNSNLDIDLNDVADGIYILNVFNTTARMTHKVVVN